MKMTMSNFVIVFSDCWNWYRAHRYSPRRVTNCTKFLQIVTNWKMKTSVDDDSKKSCSDKYCWSKVDGSDDIIRDLRDVLYNGLASGTVYSFQRMQKRINDLILLFHCSSVCIVRRYPPRIIGHQQDVVCQSHDKCDEAIVRLHSRKFCCFFSPQNWRIFLIIFDI